MRLKRNTTDSMTGLPRWQASSGTGLSGSQSSSRKFYMILAGWAILLGVAVAASLSHGDAGEAPAQPGAGNAFCTAIEEDTLNATAALDGFPEITPLAQPGQSMPRSFRASRPNVLGQAEVLLPVARILADGERPLRVLHIGDSHVAGKTFPAAVKAELTRCLGCPDPTDDACGGIDYSYVAKNGATTQTFLNDTYMNTFAQKRPDLIILSLGTNEAHGMGYREDLHQRQLDTFMESLQKACPEATVLLTTPPGDYLSSSYVNYRQMARSKHKTKQVRYTKRPNPMSSRCASLLVDYAQSHELPYWDLFNICGGEQAAQRNWSAGHYLRPDGIHFTPAGYQLQGKLLAEALVTAFVKP
ncbi:MAG: GDSL-type esterase/lipase family protein [Alloprevotella sp.]